MATLGKIEKLLLKEGIVTERQLQEALALRMDKDLRVGEALASLGHLNENVLATFLSKIYSIPAVSVEDVVLSEELVELLPAAICRKHHLIPLKKDAKTITIAISDPSNVAAIDDVRFLSNLDVQLYLSTESQIQKVINKYYSTSENINHTEMIDSAVPQKELEDAVDGALEVQSSQNEVEVDEGSIRDNKPTIRLINKIFVEAVRRGSSDIHIEPYKQWARVRFRMNGSLYEVMRIPAALKSAVAARVKVMSHLDISERRLPKTGECK